MLQSRPITENGQMLGVARTVDSGWIFIATDPRLDDLHGMRFPSWSEAERVALLVLDRERSAPVHLHQVS